MFPFKIVHIVLLVMIFIAWIVMMAGVAAFHDKSGASSTAMRPYWWGVWFEFFLVLLCVAALVLGADDWAMVLCSFCAMASAYLMNHAEFWLVQGDHHRNSDARSAADAAAAGTIMVIIVNWLIIILLGHAGIRGRAAKKVCCCFVVWPVLRLTSMLIPSHRRRRLSVAMLSPE